MREEKGRKEAGEVEEEEGKHSRYVLTVSDDVKCCWRHQQQSLAQLSKYAVLLRVVVVDSKEREMNRVSAREREGKAIAESEERTEPNRYPL